LALSAVCGTVTKDMEESLRLFVAPDCRPCKCGFLLSIWVVSSVTRTFLEAKLVKSVEGAVVHVVKYGREFRGVAATLPKSEMPPDIILSASIYGLTF
jgi:hypothetical protein